MNAGTMMGNVNHHATDPMTINKTVQQHAIEVRIHAAQEEPVSPETSSSSVSAGSVSNTNVDEIEWQVIKQQAMRMENGNIHMTVVMLRP